MKEYLTRLAVGLQVLFTTTADSLGRSTGFLQRRRRLTACGFARTLVFQWMAQPKATMETMALELEVSPQALQQRLGPKAQAFLRELLHEALRQALRTPRTRLGILDRFTAVVVEDTTTIALPASMADAFPGCGGGSGAGEGAAALKVLVRWDIVSGQLLALTVHAGRTSDRTLAAQAGDLPEGSLHLADQGFFHSERWRTLSPRPFWISRVPVRTHVHWQGAWQSLAALLGGTSEACFDAAVRLVPTTDWPCRLVARRCPPEVAGRRRQKLRAYTRDKKGREPSVAQLLLCDWVVFATNAPAERLSAVEVWVAYRSRWQIDTAHAHGTSSKCCVGPDRNSYPSLCRAA